MSGVMSIVLWALQILLAAQFVFHGVLFVAPPPDVAEQLNQIVTPEFRTFIGVVEILAAIGLIVPGLVRVAPWLTPLAAAGLMIVTASATVLHFSRGEGGNAAYTAVLFLILTFVAYMRWRVLPITARMGTSSERVTGDGKYTRAA